MQYAKTSLLAVVMMATIALFTFKGHATAAPTSESTKSPDKNGPAKVPDSIDQELAPVDTEATTFRDTEGNVVAPNRVILISPPKEYLAWFFNQTGIGELDQFRIEATPLSDKVWIFHPDIDRHGGAENGTAKFQSLPPGAMVGSELPVNEIPFTDDANQQCHVSVLQSTNDENHTVGTIQIDVGSDRRYAFPFKADITLNGAKLDSKKRVPASAKITWQKPERWKKDL